MPHSDPQVSATYKAAWSKTPVGRASQALRNHKYRVSLKGFLSEVRGNSHKRGNR